MRWLNVDLSCLGRMIHVRHFWGAKPPRRAELLRLGDSVLYAQLLLTSEVAVLAVAAKVVLVSFW